MAQIDDTISTYLTAIEVEGKTQNTVLSYRASLEDFRRVGDHLGLPSELEAYSVEHVYRFLGDLKERGASPAYRHRRHREVKTFFSWCRRMEYVTANVFAKVPLVKLDQQIRPPFSPDEIQRLLGSLDQTDLPGCRNHALIPSGATGGQQEIPPNSTGRRSTGTTGRISPRRCKRRRSTACASWVPGSFHGCD